MDVQHEPLALPELFQKAKMEVYRELDWQKMKERKPHTENSYADIPDCLTYVLTSKPKTDNTNFNKLILNLVTGFQKIGYNYQTALNIALPFLNEYPHSTAYSTPKDRVDHFRTQWDYVEKNQNYEFKCSYILGLGFPGSAFNCKKCNWIEETIQGTQETSLEFQEKVENLATGDSEEDEERLAIMIEGAAPDRAIEGTTQSYDENPTHAKQTSAAKAEAPELSYANLNLPSSLEISQMEIKVDWVVKNLIPKESITLLHSIGGVGKSYLLYGMARAVADSNPFFGLDVMKMNVYYVDFENPLPEIADRMKKIGGSQNMRIWHLGHDPAPIRFDAPQWEIYKTFPPGLFIIDSLRSSHLLDENSSKDAAIVMGRHKEIRARGNTIILIHHESKAGGYRGSTAWFDLSDHILKFSRVRAIGSDEDASEEDFNLPIRLGLGGKSRFSSAMELTPMYFKFENHSLCSAGDPDEETLNKMSDLLNPMAPPNQSEFRKLVNDNLGLKRKAFEDLLKKGEKRNFWFSRRSRDKNKLEYLRTPNEAF